MKMDDLIMKKIGVYICMVIDAGLILLAWYLSKFVDGMPAEMFTFLGIVIAGAGVLIKYLVQRFFKMDIEEATLRLNGN